MNETFSLQDYEAAMSDKLAHEEGQAPWELAAIFVFLPLSFVAVCLRVWVRKGMINCFGKDDVMMLLAFVSRELLSLWFEQLLISSPACILCLQRSITGGRLCL